MSKIYKNSNRSANICLEWGGAVRKVYLLAVFLLLGKSLFAQTDYVFVLEKPQTGSDVSISVFQTVVAAMVTDNDTLSAVSFADKVTYLFSPLPGNTPELVRIAGEKVRADPLKGVVTAAGISDSIKQANEQAKAWGRSGAVSKLIIITSSLSVGKARNIAEPDSFDSIFYLSLDSPPEQILVDIAEPLSNGSEFCWAIDTKNSIPAEDYVSLADGIYNCVHANAPKFKKLSFDSDLAGFSAGNLLQQVGKMIVLVKNTAADPVDLYKSGKKAANLSVFPQKTYSVVQVEAVSMGKFTVENGEIVLVLACGEISIIVFGAAAVVLAAIFLIIVVSLAGAAKKGREAKRPVYQVTYLKSGRDSGQLKANICKVRNRKNEGDFESGVLIKSIVEYMGIKDKLDQKVVDDFYPRIAYRADKEAWFIEYNPESVTVSAMDEPVTAGTEEYDIFGGGSSSQPTESNDGMGEESIPKDEQVTGSSFKIKRIFQNDLENKLVLTRIEY